MNPTDFDHSTGVHVKPEGWTDDQCDPLPTFKGVDEDGHPQIISCWKPTPEEILKIAAGKPVWLHILSERHPPIKLTTQNPFKLEVE